MKFSLSIIIFLISQGSISQSIQKSDLYGNWEWIHWENDQGERWDVHDSIPKYPSGSAMKPPVDWSVTFTEEGVKCMVCAGTFELETDSLNQILSTQMDCKRHGWQCFFSRGRIHLDGDLLFIEPHYDNPGLPQYTFALMKAEHPVKKK